MEMAGGTAQADAATGATRIGVLVQRMEERLALQRMGGTADGGVESGGQGGNINNSNSEGGAEGDEAMHNFIECMGLAGDTSIPPTILQEASRAFSDALDRATSAADRNRTVAAAKASNMQAVDHDTLAFIGNAAAATAGAVYQRQEDELEAMLARIRERRRADVDAARKEATQRYQQEKEHRAQALMREAEAAHVNDIKSAHDGAVQVAKGTIQRRMQEVAAAKAAEEAAAAKAAEEAAAAKAAREAAAAKAAREAAAAKAAEEAAAAKAAQEAAAAKAAREAAAAKAAREAAAAKAAREAAAAKAAREAAAAKAAEEAAAAKAAEEAAAAKAAREAAAAKAAREAAAAKAAEEAAAAKAAQEAAAAKAAQEAAARATEEADTRARKERERRRRSQLRQQEEDEPGV
ncbi:hypothetical protein JKP88DRAFT_277263 [Tribonema minus]|uniref:Uncharacterized protein n=1 Tax=Tribonema minus TaxID=303371 RepID=A0A835YYZ5_9STRA|nr:hypothetical protein JKP88DRAFT_277263 [Tribonema minus]